MRFALNHIAAPKLSLPDFLAAARDLGITEVEVRNDTPDLLSDRPPQDVRAEAEAAGVTIVAINALYPFNVWTADLTARATAMADYAAACGAKALVLCPLNDGTAVEFDDLAAALRNLMPVLQDRGLRGLVEPLGFPKSSLRTKAEAIRAIRMIGGEAVFALLHDTFHHHLAGETEFFADWTGLVHVSGVDDPDLAVAEMLDAHRVLVDGGDRLDNRGQIAALTAAGYAGPFSFEPFAASVHDAPDPVAAIRASMDHLMTPVPA